jgi:hypothetical protein
MGNQPSKLYQRLWHCLPNPDNSSSWFDKNSKPFANHEDKDQFICNYFHTITMRQRINLTSTVDAAITVLSQNGKINLEGHDVRLIYSRRDNDRMVARIVAEQEGVVKAQVAARDDGKDQNEAFLALRKHVERSIDSILKDVPGASYNGGKEDMGSGPVKDNMEGGIASPVSPRRSGSGVTQRSPVQGFNPLPVDAPPAYGKAVKDWRSGNDEKRR